jgi:hypothetical protein
MRINRRIVAKALPVVAAASLLGSTAAVADPPVPSIPPYPAAATWRSTTVPLVQINNQTVEGLPGARWVGSVTNFVTFNPAFSCLNGSRINVFTAPDFPGMYAVHNGLQGPQCTYGTWLFPQGL